MSRSALIVSWNDGIGVPLWHALERAQVRAEIIRNGPETRPALHERVADTSRSWGVIVDAAYGGRQAIELIRHLRLAFPELFILAALDAPDVAATQAVTAAGAWDYLIHPFDAEQIEACLRSWAVKSSLPPGRLICFLPARGGDGASTAALHAAEAAARQRRALGFGRRLLLADLDFQSGGVAFRLQLTPRRTLADVLQSEAFDLPWKDWTCEWLGVDVLASPPSNIPMPADGVRRVRDLISAAKAAYPLVVADMPAAMYSSSREVMAIADEVYIVCTPEITSLHIARRRVEELEGIGVETGRLRLVLNRCGSHGWIRAEEVGQVVGLPVSTMIGNDYEAMNAAVVKGGVISPRSALGRQFHELGRQVSGLDPRGRSAAA